MIDTPKQDPWYFEWVPTKRAFDLGQVSSDAVADGHGRIHRRRYADGLVSIHRDRFDPDRSWLHAVAHAIVDIIPWFFKGMPR
jgi:hypothetical protein